MDHRAIPHPHLIPHHHGCPFIAGSFCTALAAPLPNKHAAELLQGVASGLIRTCGSGMSMREGVTNWLNIHKAKQLPVLESCMPYTPTSPSCSKYKCRTSVPELQMGGFLATPLSSTWEMQRHIRQYGSIVCRINLYTDLKPFFVDKPTGVYPGPGERHGAVQPVVV
jgi:hypothetical protein